MIENFGSKKNVGYNFYYWKYFHWKKKIYTKKFTGKNFPNKNFLKKKVFINKKKIVEKFFHIKIFKAKTILQIFSWTTRRSLPYNLNQIKFNFSTWLLSIYITRACETCSFFIHHYFNHPPNTCPKTKHDTSLVNQKESQKINQTIFIQSHSSQTQIWQIF